MKRIVILMHERERPRRLRYYLIQALSHAWRSRGLEVSFVYGHKVRPEADLLIPHLDLTGIPAEYLDFMRSYSNLLNRHVLDIAKRTFSRNLLGEKDDYPGPVIVKTDRNFGGIPERRNAGFLSRARLGMQRATARFIKPDPGSAQILFRYPIFENLAAVPPAVFHNPALVVERFLPEKEGSRYFMRHYVFLGDRARNVRVAGRGPFLKRPECVLVDQDLPVPPELIDLRRRLGFDYGKFDYTMPGGKVVILDVNRTPGVPGSAESTAATVNSLADGIWSFLAGQ